MVIGMVHDESRPAMRLLEKEGFKKISEVDILEGGPIVQADTDSIRSIRDSRSVKLVRGKPDQVKTKGWGQLEDVRKAEAMRYFMVANATEFKNFKVAVCEISIEDDSHIAIPDEVAESIGVVSGDELRYVAVRPRSKL